MGKYIGRDDTTFPILSLQNNPRSSSAGEGQSPPSHQSLSACIDALEYLALAFPTLSAAPKHHQYPGFHCFFDIHWLAISWIDWWFPVPTEDLKVGCHGFAKRPEILHGELRHAGQALLEELASAPTFLTEAREGQHDDVDRKLRRMLLQAFEHLVRYGSDFLVRVITQLPEVSLRIICIYLLTYSLAYFTYLLT